MDVAQILADANIESIEPGEFLVVQVKGRDKLAPHRAAQDLGGFARILSESLDRPVPILVINEEMSIAGLDEEEMEQHGWVRKRKSKRKEPAGYNPPPNNVQRPEVPTPAPP